MPQVEINSDDEDFLVIKRRHDIPESPLPATTKTKFPAKIANSAVPKNTRREEEIRLDASPLRCDFMRSEVNIKTSFLDSSNSISVP